MEYDGGNVLRWEHNSRMFAERLVREIICGKRPRSKQQLRWKLFLSAREVWSILSMY